MTSICLRRAPAALALFAAAVALAAPPNAAAASTVDVIVGREPGLSAAERTELRERTGVEFERRLAIPSTEVVTVAAGQAAQALRELNADPDVRYAQRDGRVYVQADRSDPDFSNLWAFDNVGGWVWNKDGVADADMDIPEAWARATGAGVTVAVVDTGINASHEDLGSQMATNAGESGADANGADRRTNGIDDDGDGEIDNWRGWDFASGDNDPSDDHGHGTHVAGTVAAANANGRGVSGVAPDAKLMALKALDAGGAGYDSWIGAAFEYAAKHGARVVNASIGGEGASPIYDDVIGRYPDTLFVVAAGNDSADLDVRVESPCEVPRANVLCVGASDHSDLKADFSNYSPTSVDVFAPGFAILSTDVAGGYSTKFGTSMASPHVAGEAALILSRHPALSAVEVKRIIMDSADPKADLTAYGYRGGRANAQRALAAAALPADRDSDGVVDGIDNCPDVANAGQADRDGDGIGDVCDARPDADDRDPDADGVPNAEDNCPATANATQTDTDRDGSGDACDSTPRGPDGDADGVADMDDDCPSAYDPQQRDTDRDGKGDACDSTPRGPDFDSDGIADMDDACPATPGVTDLGGCPRAPAPLPSGDGTIFAPAPPATLPLTPAAKPSIGSVKALANGRATCRAGRCTRTVSVAAAVSPGSKVTAVTVQAKVCRRGRCSYRTVARTAGPKVSLAAGRYRVTVTATGLGGRAQKTVDVTVRKR